MLKWLKTASATTKIGLLIIPAIGGFAAAAQFAPAQSVVEQTAVPKPMAKVELPKVEAPPTPPATTPATTPPPPQPSSPTVVPSARCKDGTYSYSTNRQGTCSHHGGVSTWIGLAESSPPPTEPEPYNPPIAQICDPELRSATANLWDSRITAAGYTHDSNLRAIRADAAARGILDSGFTVQATADENARYQNELVQLEAQKTIELSRLPDC